jgi:hypothetical protein
MRQHKLKKWHKLARGIKANWSKTRARCIGGCKKRE